MWAIGETPVAGRDQALSKLEKKKAWYIRSRNDGGMLLRAVLATWWVCAFSNMTWMTDNYVRGQLRQVSGWGGRPVLHV